MAETEALPQSLKLLDHLSTSGSQLRRQLCVAVATISRQIAAEQQRALAQIWIPGFTSEGLIALTCAGAPYAIAGEGDLGALFRCVSCRYIFRPTSPDPKQRGSIGRVFHSHRPEICSNIGSAPVEMYHRVHEASQCLMHSLCVMPVWIPAITRTAPVAVLEILQPDPQPDFEALHSLAAHAFRDVTVARVTVNEPMPDLLSSGGALAPEADRDPFGRAHRPPGAAMRATRQAHADGAPAPGGTTKSASDGVMPPCEHLPAGAGEERMQMVFDDRERAQDSGEHMQNVAEQLATKHIPELSMHLHAPPPATAACGLEDAGSSEQDVPGGGAARTSQNGSNNIGPECGHNAQSDLAGSHGAPRDGGSPCSPQPSTAAHAQELSMHEVHAAASMPERSRVSQPRGASMAPPVAIHTSASLPNLVPKMEPMSPRQGMRNGNSAVPEAPVYAGMPPMMSGADTAGAAQRAAQAEQDVHNVSDMCQAIELLHVVQQDQGWQTAERQGGSLHGSAAALLSALQSPANEAAMMRANNNGLATGSSAAAAPPAASPAAPSSHSDVGGIGGIGAVGGPPPPPPRMKRAHGIEDPLAVPQRKATPSGPAAALAAGLEAPETAALIGAEHRQFGYPGGGTFVRVPQQPGAVGAGAGPGPASLQDKVLRADACSIGASTAGMPAGAPQASALAPGANAPHAVPMTAPPADAPNGGGQEAVYGAQAPWPGATGAPGAAPALAPGLSVHPSLHNSMHASTHSPLPPGSLRGSMHVSGPLGATPTLAGSGSLSAVDISNAPVDLDPNELKALRNRVNRSDGGIGRKLTLDVLQQHFGKGLKEAAESLGMCPTTLKRACRRLGVKRWPRTPEAAAQVVGEAQEAQRVMAAHSAAVPPGFVSQFGGRAVVGGAGYGLGMGGLQGPPLTAAAATGGYGDGMGAPGTGDPVADAEAHMLLMDSGEVGEEDNLGVGELDDFLEMWGED